MQYIHFFIQATPNNVAFFSNLFAIVFANNPLSGMPYRYKKAEGDITEIDQFGRVTLITPATENQTYIFAALEKTIFEQTDFSALNTEMVHFENNEHIDYLQTNFY